jgi:hypothetical protein
MTRRRENMTTERQLNANRQNAQKSTGPRTPQGKRISAQNAASHGLRSACVLIASDDPAQYQAHHAALMDELAPVGATEYLLADRIAALHWQLQRATGLQAQVFEAHMIKPPAPRRVDYTDEELTDFENLKDLGITRSQYDYLIEGDKSTLLEIARGILMDYQEECDKVQRRNALGAIAVRDFSETRVLERLVVYERRIENSLHKSRRELDALQTRRLAEENQQRLIEEEDTPAQEEIAPQDENAPNEPNLDTPATTTDQPNLLPGNGERKNHFSQNKPNFQTQQNTLTPFSITGCPKPAAGSGPKNKPKQSQFPDRLTANC